MRVLLYDQDLQRNKCLKRYLENKNIQVKAVYQLRDFLMKIEKPSLKIVIVEQTLVQHYNLNIEDVLYRLGLELIVIVYVETEDMFDFSIHYVEEYLYFPFTTAEDKQLFKAIKKHLKKRKKKKAKHAAKIEEKRLLPGSTDQKNDTAIESVMHLFTQKQRILITQLIEKKEGITIEEMIRLLDAEKMKNAGNYVQVQIYRLRNKLNSILGKKYIISCNDHTYRLIYQLK